MVTEEQKMWKKEAARPGWRIEKDFAKLRRQTPRPLVQSGET